MLFGKPKRIVKRILIVEDEPLVAFDMETMLADEGYEVVDTLDTFAAAIARLDREQVDLILCDVRLHGDQTGINLAQRSLQARHSGAVRDQQTFRRMRTNWRSAA